VPQLWGLSRNGFEALFLLPGRGQCIGD
jgi:hypothetical protein